MTAAGLPLPLIANAVLSLMGVAMLLAFVRLLLGPTQLDRVVALDLIGILSVGMTAVNTIRTGREVFLDVAIVMALIAFLSTVAMARFLEKRGRM